MSSRGVATEFVWLRGADAVTYADSQSTQDLAGLAVGDQTETFVLDPKGELVAHAVVRRVEDELVSYEIPLGVGAPLRARLERFAIRSKVEFDGRESPVPPGAAAIADELERVRAGVPGPAELARGLVVHGVGEDLRERSVSFTKGCYTGQELVARMQARGATPPYVLCRLELQSPAYAGDAVGDPTREGTLTTVAHDPNVDSFEALAVVHRRDAAGGTVEVRSSSGTQLAKVLTGHSVRSDGGHAARLDPGLSPR